MFASELWALQEKEQKASASRSVVFDRYTARVDMSSKDSCRLSFRRSSDGSHAVDMSTSSTALLLAGLVRRWFENWYNNLVEEPLPRKEQIDEWTQLIANNPQMPMIELLSKLTKEGMK